MHKPRLQHFDQEGEAVLVLPAYCGWGGRMRWKGDSHPQGLFAPWTYAGPLSCHCFTLSVNELFSLKFQKSSHSYFLGKFSLSLSTKVFTLFHMFSDVMLRFVRVWRCLWAGPHKHFKGPRLYQQGQGYQASALWLPSFTWINRSTGWHKWTSWRRFWTSTSAYLWLRNSGAPSLNRWDLKQPRK